MDKVICPNCQNPHCGCVCECDRYQSMNGAFKDRPHATCCHCGTCFGLIRTPKTDEQREALVEKIRRA